MTVIVLIQAGAVVDMKRNGTIKDYPPGSAATSRSWKT